MDFRTFRFLGSTADTHVHASVLWILWKIALLPRWPHVFFFFHSLFLSSVLSLSVLCERPRTCTILVVRDVGRVYEFRFIYAGKAVSLRSPRWLWGATECPLLVVVLRMAFVILWVYVFVEFMAIGPPEVCKKPLVPSGTEGVRPSWLLVADGGGMPPVVRSTSDIFPCSLCSGQSIELPATTVGEWRRRRSL